jgi:dihydroxyacetone kinase
VVAQTKKLINNPDDLIAELIDGIVGAHPRQVRASSRHPRVVVAAEGPREGKVGMVIGGGSGHEPAFVGYVGRGLADAAALGNVFASPPPEPIMEAAKEVHRGAGVAFIYCNYAGDVMNFDMAAEFAAMEDIEIRSAVVTDDVASAPLGERQKRRGVAGSFFVFKAAGAAADEMRSLDAVIAAANKANAATYSMGVALSACSLPHTRRLNFELGEEDMEIGMGIHGEPGIQRGRVQTADQVADQLVDRILAEADLTPGDEVSLLVNGLGATPIMELYLIFRRVKQRLDAQRVSIHRSFVGEYVTSLEMAGCSVTLAKLDDELKQLYDRPCDCAMFRVV